MTIISRLGILAYFFVLVSSIVNREKTVQMSFVSKSATQDVQKYPITLNDFDIGF